MKRFLAFACAAAAVCACTACDGGQANSPVPADIAGALTPAPAETFTITDVAAEAPTFAPTPVPTSDPTPVLPSSGEANWNIGREDVLNVLKADSDDSDWTIVQWLAATPDGRRDAAIYATALAGAMSMQQQGTVSSAEEYILTLVVGLSSDTGLAETLLSTAQKFYDRIGPYLAESSDRTIESFAIYAAALSILNAA